MNNAIKECLAESREYELINTLRSASLRLRYNADKFIKELLKVLTTK